MMTEEEKRQEHISTNRAASLSIAEDGRLSRSVELFLQQMKKRRDTEDLVTDSLRVEGLASVSQGKEAVKSWLLKF